MVQTATIVMNVKLRHVIFFYILSLLYVAELRILQIDVKFHGIGHLTGTVAAVRKFTHGCFFHRWLCMRKEHLQIDLAAIMTVILIFKKLLRLWSVRCGTLSEQVLKFDALPTILLWVKNVDAWLAKEATLRFKLRLGALGRAWPYSDELFLPLRIEWTFRGVHEHRLSRVVDFDTRIVFALWAALAMPADANVFCQNRSVFVVARLQVRRAIHQAAVRVILSIYQTYDIQVDAIGNTLLYVKHVLFRGDCPLTLAHNIYRRMNFIGVCLRADLLKVIRLLHNSLAGAAKYWPAI